MPKLRYLLAMLASVAFICVCGGTAYEAMSMRGKPFNGFFIESRANVSGFQGLGWKLDELGLTDADQIQAVNGVVVVNARDIYRAALSQPAGTPLSYAILRNGQPVVVTIPSRLFTWSDFHASYTLVLIQAMVTFFVGLLIFLLGTDRVISRTMFTWAFFTGTGGVLLFDFSTLGTASRFLYVLSIAGGAAELGFALGLLHRKIGPRITRGLLSMLAAAAATYIVAHQLVFADANVAHSNQFPLYDLNVWLSRNSVFWFIAGELAVLLAVLWLLIRSRRGTQEHEEACLLLIASIFVQLGFIFYAFYLVTKIPVSLPYSMTLLLGLIGQATFAYAILRRRLFGVDMGRLLSENSRLDRLVQEQSKELRDAQAQLIHSEKMNALGRMVAGIAHEVNNPITSLYGGLGMIQADLAQIKSAVREYENRLPSTSVNFVRQEFHLTEAFENLETMLGSMQLGATRIRDIVRRLKTYARDDSREEHAPFELRECVEATVVMVATSFRQVRFHVDLSPVPLVLGHVGMVSQALTNLLVNACQAVGEEGDVWIALRATDEGIQIVIRDNGTGIPSEIVPCIFDPFFTTKPPGEGTGLGLGITRSIIHAHGGTLAVESAEDEGTTVTLHFPNPKGVVNA